MTINNRIVKVAAIDFDGTLFKEDKFPEVGEPIWSNINYVKELKRNGIELILYTNREGSLLEDAVNACKQVGIEFDAVNANLQWRIDKYGNDCRKIGADVYLDDKALNPKNIKRGLLNSFDPRALTMCLISMFFAFLGTIFSIKSGSPAVSAFGNTIAILLYLSYMTSE